MMLDHVLAVLVAVGMLVVVLATAPWWFRILDPVMQLWLRWMDRWDTKR